MRSLLLAALLPALACAAPALEIVKPVISAMEGGSPDPTGFEYTQGQSFFFSCRVANYARTADFKVHLAYSVQPFDAQGVPLIELFKNEIEDELTVEDKEWQPKIAIEIAIPPLIFSGAYKIVVKVDDLVAKTSAELSVPFHVRGLDPVPADAMAVRNLRFFRDETATQPLEKAAYRSGDGLWARFIITGFSYGEGNRIDVSYQTSILGVGGKVLWTQPEPAVERSQSFYPKRYVEATMSLSLQGTRPGQYTLAVRATDALGNRTAEASQVFTVE